MSHFKNFAIGLAVLAMSVPSVQAATQGAVGATSTGTLNITAPLGGRVKISYIDDLDFTTALASWDGSSDVSLFDDLCVWSNTGGYNITATGDGGMGGGTAFLLDDSTNDLAYGVQWNDQAGTSTGAQSLTASTPLNTQGNASSGATCSSGSSLTARVIVTLSGANLGTAVAGTYTGVLTMTVAPE